MDSSAIGVGVAANPMISNVVMLNHQVEDHRDPKTTKQLQPRHLKVSCSCESVLEESAWWMSAEDPEAAAKAKGGGCKLHCTPDTQPTKVHRQSCLRPGKLK